MSKIKASTRRADDRVLEEDISLHMVGIADASGRVACPDAL